MENIVQSNNRDLRLVAVKVGVLSTLRLALPDVPANATRVEVIVTNGDTHTAYGAHLDTNTERWLVDVAAEQFPYCGKQKYEIAYLLDGKQFWDGAGWVTVEDATTGGITPSPAPDPARYVVTRINGYGAPDPDGDVRIPRTFVGTEDPTTTDGFIEYDQFFNRVTGALFVLCSVVGTLTWVKTAGAVLSVNGKVGAVVLSANDVGAYSKNETNEALANKLDKTAVVAPSESVTTGQAADAKATHDALAEKLSTSGGLVNGDISINAPEPILSVTANGTNYASLYVSNGNHTIRITTGAEENGHVLEKPKIEIDGVPVPMPSDIADATKLTPVLDADGHVTGYKLGDKASPVLLTDDAKAALFAGADFIAAVKKYGGTQIKEDEKGFYYEVDEEA